VLRKFFWMIVACASLLPVSGAFAAPAHPPFPVESFFLDNGMQVVVLPDHRAAIVTHMVWYRVGAADEPAGQSGVAHFLEHLLFKRTEKLNPGDFAKIVARNGGRHNAFTGQDYTGYYQTVAKDRLPLMMALEADRMANLRLEDEDIKAERDVILEERSMRVDGRPSSLLSEEMDALLFRAHPYGIPVIGWRHEMEALSLQDSWAFYKKYYNPANAILIIAGDVTTAQVRDLAEKYYGPIAGTALPKRARVQEPPMRGPRRVELADSRVKQPSWRRFYATPSYSAGQDKELAPALDVLMDIIAGGTTSRLYRHLVVDQKVAVSVGGWYQGWSFDPAKLALYATPPKAMEKGGEHGLDLVETQIDLVLNDVKQNGVTEDEVRRAVNKLVAEATYARDSIDSMAQIFGRGLTTGLSIADIQGWTARIEAVTPADVQRAAQRIFQPERSVTGLLLQSANPAMKGEQP